MAYVKTQNGQVQKFPYTMGDFRKDSPNTSFPKNIPDDLLAEFGVFEVLIDTPSTVDEKNYKAVRADVPTYVNDAWHLEWSVVAKSEEEKQRYYDGFAERVRSKRNELLSQSDWTQLPDSNVNKTAWATYRQALRDVPEQSGFPWEVTWPTQPE